MANSAPVRLKTVVTRNSHYADIGKVPTEGFEFDFVEVKPAIAAYRRMVRDLEYDICAIAPTTYMIARAYGVKFKALPVIGSRRFHHAGLLVRPDSGIKFPKDLEGRKVGVRAWTVTTGVWTRGILQNQYGVDLNKVTWVVDDEEHVTQMPLPSNVVHVAEGKSLAGMMAANELQAGFDANAGIGREGPPQEGWEAKGRPEAPKYDELFAHADVLGRDWFVRTGIYPFHSVIAIKEEVLNAHPGIGKAIYRSFVAAKALWLERFKAGTENTEQDRRYKSYLPLMGDDPVPYGLNANLTSINALIDIAHQQKMLPKRFSAEEMFVDVGE